MNASDALLVVDLGNSAAKVARFRRGAPVDPTVPLAQTVGRYALASWRQMLGPSGPGWEDPLLADPVDEIRIVSVHSAATADVLAWAARVAPRAVVRELTWRDFPLEVRVDFPDRLGLDRLAAATAAVHGQRSVARRDASAAGVASSSIVIDVGTAVTVDLVTADGCFSGGAILAGPTTVAGALAKATDRLPLIAELPDRRQPIPLVGSNTQDALRSGLVWGLVGGVRELVERFQGTLEQPAQVWLTGGGAHLLLDRLPWNVRYQPDLVLIGAATADVAFSGHLTDVDRTGVDIPRVAGTPRPKASS